MVASESNRYDIFSAQAQRNYDLYEQMRNEDPIHAAVDPQTGYTVWFLTRYEDCLNFLRDKRFGKEYRRQLPAHLIEDWHMSEADDVINQHMLNLDDPSHAHLKSLVQLAFTPIRINNLRPRLQTLADYLFDRIEAEIGDGDEFDLSDQYISQLPLMSIAAMLGIPLNDYQNMYFWTQHMLSSDHAVVYRALDEFSAYLDKQIDMRRDSPDQYDDLLAGLIFAEDAGNRLSRQELLSMVFLLITAGYETMVNFIGNSVLTLFDNPDQMRLLQDNVDNPDVIKSAIEELLRYSGPSHMTLPSWAFVDVEMGGKVIRQGEVVHAVLAAANRDPNIFDHPNTFDIFRQPNKHVAFSYGMHHCLGAALARLEGEIAIATLLRRMPNL